MRAAAGDLRGVAIAFSTPLQPAPTAVGDIITFTSTETVAYELSIGHRSSDNRNNNIFSLFKLWKV